MSRRACLAAPLCLALCLALWLSPLAAGAQEAGEANSAFLDRSLLEVLQNQYGLDEPDLYSSAMAEAINRLAEYQTWRQDLVSALEQGAQVVQTAWGPVQYGALGSGPVVLMCHGGSMGYDNIQVQAELAQAGYRVICPSRPGYLSTPADPGLTLALEADWLAQFLDALGIEEPVVVHATSLGGAVAIQFALRHASRTRALIMQDAVVLPYIVSEALGQSWLGSLLFSPTWPDTRSWLLRLAGDRWPASLLAEYFATTNPYTPAQNLALAQRLMADAGERQKFSSFLDMSAPNSLRSSGTNQEIQQAVQMETPPVEQIQAPILVVHSLLDTDVPFSHAQYLADHAARVELYPVSGVGHLFWLGDAWPGTVRAMLEFLGRHAPQAQP